MPDCNPDPAAALTLEDLAVGDPMENPALARHLIAIGELKDSDLVPGQKRPRFFSRLAKPAINMPVLNDILVMHPEQRATQARQGLGFRFSVRNRVTTFRPEFESAVSGVFVFKILL